MIHRATDGAGLWRNGGTWLGIPRPEPRFRVARNFCRLLLALVVMHMHVSAIDSDTDLDVDQSSQFFVHCTCTLLQAYMQVNVENTSTWHLPIVWFRADIHFNRDTSLSLPPLPPPFPDREIVPFKTTWSDEPMPKACAVGAQVIRLSANEINPKFSWLEIVDVFSWKPLVGLAFHSS